MALHLSSFSSLTAQRHLMFQTGKVQDSMRQLGSGLRITRAADDASGLGVSERMRARGRSLRMAARNVQDGISFAQVGEGALNEMHELIGRARELAMQARSQVLTDEDRAILDSEYTKIGDEIREIKRGASFNGVDFFNGGRVFFQVGVNEGDELRFNTPQFFGTLARLRQSDIDTFDNAANALTRIDEFMDVLNGKRTDLGVLRNRFEAMHRNLQTASISTTATESRIRDVDIAEVTASYTRNSILQNAANSVLSQANVQPELALQLIGN